MESSFGRRVKMARIERGFSQQQLAAQTGLRQSHLSMIENGRHDPSATIVRKLAEALDVDANFLLGLSSDLKGMKGKDKQKWPAGVGLGANHHHAGSSVRV
jgi:transcriptional regulator with XRE-family HTH domain